MALSTGFSAGVNAGNAIRAGMRANDKHEWEKEDRERLRKERGELDEIKRAGQEALATLADAAPSREEALAHDMAVRRRVQEAVLRANQPQAQQQPVPTLEPVATATPVAPPGSGAAPAAPAANLTMEEVTPANQPTVAPYPEPQNHPPPPGSTIPPGTPLPSMDELRAPAAAPQPAPAQGATMRQAATPDQLDRINAMLSAQSQKATELGRADEALALHIQGMQVRDRLRGLALDRAEQQFRTTGDVNAFVPVFNRYFPGNAKVDSLTKQPDGSYAMKGRTLDGKEFTQTLSAKQMSDYVEFIRNPQAARALEAKRAEELRKQAFELRKIREQNRIQRVGPGDTLADTTTGQTYTAPRADKFGLRTVKNDDGSETLVRYNEATGATEPVITGTRADGSQLPKRVVDMQKDAVKAVMELNEVGSEFAMMDPDKQQTVTTQVGLAADLVAANYETDNWRGMSHAKAAEIAKAITDGKAQRVKMRVPGRDESVDGVIHEGRKYLLDPNVRAGGRRGGNSEAQKQFNNDPTVRAYAAGRERRESERVTVLRDEAERARQLVDSAVTPEQRQRAETALASILRELDIATGGGVPTLADGIDQVGLGTTKVSGRVTRQ